VQSAGSLKNLLPRISRIFQKNLDQASALLLNFGAKPLQFTRIIRQAF
jgi:hypothetical protein